MFRHYDTYSIQIHGALIIGPPVLLTATAGSPSDSISTILGTLFWCFATYVVTLLASIAIYRLSWFHPLARFPGSALDSVSQFYPAYRAAYGYQHEYHRQLHAQYGDIVRTGASLRSRVASKRTLKHLAVTSMLTSTHFVGPNELSIADPLLIPGLIGPSGQPKGPRKRLHLFT